MTYTSPTQVPATYQSRPDSAPNKSFNCGPSSITHVARFYKDRDFGINDTRRLGTLKNYTGTTPAQRALMLAKRGVNCKDDRISGSYLITLVRSRPVSVSLLMSKVPYPYRRYSFSGLHEMTAVAIRSTTSVAEMAFMDPNYGWPDGETGYQPGLIWMPYNVWYPAFAASGGWAVIPDDPKKIVIPTRRPYVKSCVTLDALNVRSGPGTNYSLITTLAKGTKFKSTQIETKGGAYTANGKRRTDWLSFVRNGRVVWVARGFVKET